MVFKLFLHGPGVTEIAGRVTALADDHTPDGGRTGFVILVCNAVIADERIGHHENLARVGRVGDDLLVTHDRRVENDLADPADVGSESDSVEFFSVFKHQFFCLSLHI